MIDREIKKRFAEEWLRRPHDPFYAARLIAANDTLLACRLIDQLLSDPEVEQLKAELLEEKGEEAFLPTEGEMLHDIFHRARETRYDDDYHKLMRLAAEMRGMIQKPGITINNTVTSNKVMVVPVRLNNEDWEKGLIEQQQGLLSHG